MGLLHGLWKSGSESQAARDAKMRERVAITAIYGERIIATFDGCTAAAPTAVYEHPHLQEQPMTTVVHADVHQVGHHLVGPYAAAQLYLQENKQHRDELLAAAAAEE